MTTTYLSRLHLSAGVSRHFATGPLVRQGALRLLALLSPLRRQAPAPAQWPGRPAAEAPWVAEMLSAFGGAFVQVGPTDAPDRRRPRRQT